MLSREEIEQIPLVIEIRAHEKELDKDIPPCNLDQCLRCKILQDPHAFLRHDTRKREFFVVAGRMIYKIHSVLSVWKCPLCGKYFTVYPRYALPYARYTLEEMEERAQRYIEQDRTTYRRNVLKNRMPLYHDTEDFSEADRTPVMAPSTPYRWITRFSLLFVNLCALLSLIKQASPESSIFRELVACRIHPRKYRSEARKAILYRCRESHLTMRAYEKNFGKPLFHNLEIIMSDP